MQNVFTAEVSEKFKIFYTKFCQDENTLRGKIWINGIFLLLQKFLSLDFYQFFHKLF